MRPTPPRVGDAQRRARPGPLEPSRRHRQGCAHRSDAHDLRHARKGGRAAVLRGRSDAPARQRRLALAQDAPLQCARDPVLLSPRTAVPSFGAGPCAVAEAHACPGRPRGEGTPQIRPSDVRRVVIRSSRREESSEGLWGGGGGDAGHHRGRAPPPPGPSPAKRSCPRARAVGPRQSPSCLPAPCRRLSVWGGEGRGPGGGPSLLS